jgi:hypothetical protein
VQNKPTCPKWPAALTYQQNTNLGKQIPQSVWSLFTNHRAHAMRAKMGESSGLPNLQDMSPTATTH